MLELLKFYFSNYTIFSEEDLLMYLKGKPKKAISFLS